ncbi:membrane protein [Aureimonas sp. SA4125]|uniref:DMT family transporter n=1 Tax=Aureimonas sp. SA4125 TaxID=2826993 RepID=UPI001CC73249|nr:DMT family transporter [Aureimonas sp. SA4125]BDA83501.1 membrane protein [Aureimonas sp. SA4125]
MTVRSPAPPAAAVGLSVAAALALLVLGAMAMGISPVFVRNSEVSSFASAFWRVALALPLLLVWARAGRKTAVEPLWAGLRRPPILLSGLFFSGDLIFWHLAIAHTTIANATFLACLAPLWVALLSRLTIGEAVSRHTVIGLCICVPGAALLILHSAGSGQWLGDLYGVLTSFFFGIYFLTIRTARKDLGAGPTTFLSTLVTAIILLAAAMIAGGGFAPDSASGATNLLALGVISHAGGQGLLTIALGVLSASFSSLVIFVEAVAAALFGWLFAGEALVPLQVIGGLLILFGVWIARPRPVPEE